MMMTRMLALIMALLLCIGSSCEVAESAKEKPNILFIMSDDHATQAFGVYGSRLAKLDPTPNIDRLAREGMLLTNVFCNNSICTPSRASIMTGQFPQTNGVLDLRGRLKPQQHYLVHEMKKAGYLTAMIGKWHLKVEPSSFDYYKVLPGQGLYHNPVFKEKGQGEWPNNLVKHEGQHSSDAITDSSLAWLKARDTTKPFFLMHHFKAPHDMFQNAKRYDNYLKDVHIPEPESLYHQPHFGSIATRGENDSLITKIGASISKRNKRRNMGIASHMNVDQSLEGDAYTKVSYQRYLKRYLRCVKGVDDNVKRLFDYLETENLMDNTLIIYTSDQGFMLGEHDYMDKRWMYEESMRMPFLVRYPKTIKAGSTSDAMINNCDFAPTILEFAGVKTPEYMQGRGFKSILETGKEPSDWPQATYYRYWMHMAHRLDNPAHFGIRTKKYKLIFYYSQFYNKPRTKPAVSLPVAWEFYDLSKDPKELHNRYKDAAYQDVIADLKKQLIKMREDLNETDKNYPHIQKVIDKHWND